MQPGTELENVNESGEVTGLEDLDSTDLKIPRINIIHTEALFEDSLSGEKFEKLDCIMLGLVKQRIMWNSDIDNSVNPECKSPDHETGFPALKGENLYPWDDSNFKREDFLLADDGQIRLPCVKCKFKDWGPKAGPQQKSTPPRCSEQFTFPILFRASETDEYSAALWTIQKTGLKPAREYLSSFASKKQALFTKGTIVTLDIVNKTRQVKYSVPKFVGGPDTDRDLHAIYAKHYIGMRAFVQADPIPREDDDDAYSSYVESSVVETPAAAPTLPNAPAATTQVQVDDDELPF